MSADSSAFRDWYARRSRKQVCWLPTTAYVVSALFLFSFPRGAPSSYAWLIIGHLIVLAPPTAFFWRASERAFARWWELLAAFSCFVYVASIVGWISIQVSTANVVYSLMALTLVPSAAGFAACLRGRATACISAAGCIGGSFASAPLPMFADGRWVFVALILATSGLFSTVAAYRMENALRRELEATRLLDDQRARADALLHNMLPTAIAEQLKHSPGTIAERFDEATVLFADIVGFTPLTQRLSAEDVVAMLNELFSAFDDITERYALEKIKTIGDAYMIVGGVPKARPDHAHAVAAMALEMRDVVARHPLHGAKLALRIGIHTGPVVAGVIGKRKYLYDLWGDTVNTASRMESHGVADAVHVSEAAYEHLRDAFVLEARGEIEVKGKGAMRTYWLRGRQSAPRVALGAAREHT